MLNIRPILLISIAVVCSAPSSAQSGASIINLGYQNPVLPLVAPGQVLHLTLYGISTQFDSTQVASAIPLPTDFNGLSVSLRQSGSASPVLLPLLRGEGAISPCGLDPILVPPSNVVPCSAGPTPFDLTVQIPFDLNPNQPGIDNSACNTAMPPVCQANANDAVLTVSEKSGPGMSLRVYPVVHQIHVLTSCLSTGVSSVYATYPCCPTITHGDFSAVSWSSPAMPGEELVIFAFGLGVPDTPVNAVSATPAAGVRVSRPIRLSFTGIAEQNGITPEYVGLVGGEAGVYQINFQVPQVAPGIPTCTAQNPTNLTMTIQGTSSSDQAAFCVQP